MSSKREREECGMNGSVGEQYILFPTQSFVGWRGVYTVDISRDYFGTFEPGFYVLLLNVVSPRTSSFRKE